MKTLSMLLICCAFVFAQDKPKEPQVNISQDLQLKALKAQHQIDEIEKNKKDLQLQLAQLLKDWDDKETKAKKELDAAETEIYRQAGKDKTKDELSLDTFQFTPKSATPPKGEQKQ